MFLSIFFDELSYFISEKLLHPSMVTWIRESFTGLLVEEFVVADKDVSELQSCLKENDDGPGYVLKDIWMKLDMASMRSGESATINTESIVLATLDDSVERDEDVGHVEQSLVSAKEENDAQASIAKYRNFIALLPPCFKLLQTIEFFESESLDGVDKVQGMGIVMFKKEFVETNLRDLSYSQKEAVCTSLLVAINYFRELVNAFSKTQRSSTNGAAQSNDLVHGCILRLRHILEIEKLLATSMDLLPGWRPFRNESYAPEYLDGGGVAPADVGVVNPRKRKVGAQGKKKGTQLDKDQDEESTSETDNPEEEAEDHEEEETSEHDESTAAPSKGKGKKKVITRPKTESKVLEKLERLKNHFRELEMNVFELLTNDCFELNVTGSKTDKGKKQGPSIELPELNYLLRDMLEKVQAKVKMDFASTAAPSRGAGHGDSCKDDARFSLLARIPPADFFRRMITFLPSLCKIWEEVGKELRKLHATDEPEAEEADDLVDGLEEVTKRLAECFDLVLQIFLNLSTWPSLTEKTDDESLK
ncbi:Fanconi anemia group D2 protein, partial [Dinochytrium kinnereticum]